MSERKVTRGGRGGVARERRLRVKEKEWEVEERERDGRKKGGVKWFYNEGTEQTNT